MHTPEFICSKMLKNLSKTKCTYKNIFAEQNKKLEEALAKDKMDAKNADIIATVKVMKGHYDNDLMHLHKIQWALAAIEEVASIIEAQCTKPCCRDTVVPEQLRCLLDEPPITQNDAYDMMCKTLMDDTAMMEKWVIPQVKKVLKLVREQFE